MNLTRSAWAEINLALLSDNVERIRSRVGKTTEIMAVVKSDAYGHGAVKVAELLIKKGVARLAVAFLNEAILLREAGIEGPILLLGMFSQNEVETIVEYDLTPTVSTLECMSWLESEAIKQRKKVMVHVRVDIGSAGFGVQIESCIAFLHEANAYPHVYKEGLFTHLTGAYGGNPIDVMADIEAFKRLIVQLQQLGLCPPVIHAASSPGILQYPEAYFNLVRPGILLYGLPVYEGCEDSELKPVMQLKAKVVHLNLLKQGTRSGYGKRLAFDRDIKLAQLPIGYGDGLFLYHMKQGEVLIRGQRAPIIGQIYMDHFMVDVTHIEGVVIGDEAVLIGSQGEESITALQVTTRAGIASMNSDCVHLLSARIPRFYVEAHDAD